MTGNVNVEFEGPDAVDSTRQVLSSVDVEGREVQSVKVEVCLGPAESNGSAEQAEAGADHIVRDGVEYPQKQVEPIRHGTHDHISLVCLAWTIEDTEKKYVSAAQVAAQPFCPLDERQVTNALGRLFRVKFAIQRKRVQSSGGRTYKYRPTDEGFAKAETLGQFDVDDEDDDE